MVELELLKLFEDYLPEQQVSKNLDKSIAELIAWGLLTPIMDEGDVQALSVHSLARDFCRDQSRSDRGGRLAPAIVRCHRVLYQPV